METQTLEGVATKTENAPEMVKVLVEKRDGRVVDFDPINIISAVKSAFADLDKKIGPQEERLIRDIANQVEAEIKDRYNGPAKIEDIQNLVEHGLIEDHLYDVARTYTNYRLNKDIERAKATDINEAVRRLVDRDEALVRENANKDSNVYSTQRDLLAGAVSKAAAFNMLPPAVSNAHMKGDIHFHDADYSPFTAQSNCSLPNYWDMLANGFTLGNAPMGSPNSISIAATQITQIMKDVASSQYGGQTANRADEHFAEYAKKDYDKFLEQAHEIMPDDLPIEIAERQVRMAKAVEPKRLHFEKDRPALPMDEPFDKTSDRLQQLREIWAKIQTRKAIYDATTLPVDDALAFFDQLDLTGNQQIIAAQILKEIHARLGFLQSVGLSYLTLSRASGTLSGGESQRIRLATQIGSSLMGVLYILDEPSIGLHQRDNDKLLATLQRLRDLGNTLIVVEHDEDTMRAADYLIDIGPGAGALGGQVVACGTPEEVMANPDSLTGQYLSGKRTIPLPAQRRRGNGRLLTVRGARENNLKHIDVSIPLGTFTCVTGVSGSGKSSLINEVLFKALGAQLNRMKVRPGKHDAIEGMEQLDKVIAIDQSPIGRTPRSNPATYTNLFTLIRDLFASTPDAKARGYGPGRFSFNTKGGRCEACGGDGMLKIEMHFLSDVYVPCEICRGKRYNRETLEVRYKGKNIADVLDMTVDEAWEFFSAVPAICDKLATLRDVGLGYVKLGQPSTTLSGGEAQRVKLATELSRRATGRTVYILDEPTTGLHADDVRKLLEVLQRLTDGGNTVLVIEHNLDVIKCADYIIDLGPEGGVGGGTVVACGTPEEIAACPASYTGQYLKKYLK